MSWASLPDSTRDEFCRRRYEENEPIEKLAREAGIPTTTLDRRLREWYYNMPGLEKSSENGRFQVSDPDVSCQLSEPTPLPDNNQLFQILKKGPVSLRDLSRKLDRSEDTVLELIERMEESGYDIYRQKAYVGINKEPSPTSKPRITLPIGDDAGQEIRFGVVSDIHSGSVYCQPTQMNKFIKEAVNDFGIRNFFIPGDVTTGIYGYKGHLFDMIPSIRPIDRKYCYLATLSQISLADMYIPRIPGVRYYVIGGNHDWWHVIHSGINAVAKLCSQRDDMFYLGYDAADVPLTDRVAIRMWHPSGGVPYALSYRLQKNVEQVAFEELNKLINQELPPKVRFLLAGHLHVEVKFQRGPLTASQCGCFEGQTNYLKRKGLYPSIGGQIWRIRLTNRGEILRVGYDFIPFPELMDDWKNWPIPNTPEIVGEPEKVDVLFSLDNGGDGRA